MDSRLRGNDTGVSPESAAAPAHLTPGTRDLIGALELKRRSLFCMEPPGANPVRRSMYDSLLAGCIPVFIMSASEFGAFLPRPFFDRRHNMSVRIDPSELPTVDLHARLAEINRSGRALRMRRAIARHAHRLVYSPHRCETRREVFMVFTAGIISQLLLCSR